MPWLLLPRTRVETTKNIQGFHRSARHWPNHRPLLLRPVHRRRQHRRNHRHTARRPRKERHTPCSLVMPESYVGLPFMDVDTPENEARKKAKAAADLARFIEIIKERRTGAEELTIGRWPRINSRLLGGFFTIRLITDKPFHVTTDLCTGCGLCAASCPTGNITPCDGNRPIWRHDGTCLACFACYHHCPTRSIAYGKISKGKGHYICND